MSLWDVLARLVIMALLCLHPLRHFIFPALRCRARPTALVRMSPVDAIAMQDSVVMSLLHAMLHFLLLLAEKLIALLEVMGVSLIINVLVTLDLVVM